MKLGVVYRIETSGSVQPDPSPSPLVVDRCLSALIMSLVKALSLNVLKEVQLLTLTHGLNDTAAHTVQQLYRRCPFVTETLNLDPLLPEHSPTHTHAMILEKYGNLDMLMFVETSCLLAPEAVEQMILDYQMMTAMNGEDLIISPFDDLDLYHQPQSSLIVAGRNRYWRTVGQSRPTVLMSQRAYGKAWHGKDTLAILTPMPSLAISLEEAIPLPFVPWEDWVRQSQMPPPEECKLRVPPGIL